MADIIVLNDRRKVDDADPMDGVDVCTITITGVGDVSVWVHDYIETTEQQNWLIAKIGAAMAAVIRDKEDRLAK
ncbi:hypothetical protein [Sinorhizobium meliloti]|uniref:hypothetical protein n=1 Tax=Rhizobium meliloti TaxID=382 RepID=UPI000FD95785|nr:hypothetical protein [Sinorhizobium meliloti]RVG88686.1 hypothetical protein CN219_03710 [Sinorhizobium meliloti]RVI39032.1 hypothetical protein CN197_02525 [Sinorhizobium meliloti]RVI46667.1 hypothetical protein CN196_09375 [Sinorhizobium meliloti]RVJ25669.1 hypothetical protein CN177_13415 [Sinorhizobium meliloti]RVK02252.1 hypothetical protein CN170_08715 [Sinorhizobium meliloti]